MNLNEIKLVFDKNTKPHYNITDFDKKTIIGYSEGNTLLVQSKSYKDQRVILIGLYNKEELLSSIMGYFFEFNDIEYFKILDVFTPIEFRNQGYATSLYTTLVRKYHFKLMSDNEQTNDGKRLWVGISKILNVRVLDAMTNTIITKDMVSDEDIYFNESNRYLLIAEHISTGIDQIGISSIGDGILENRKFYTHPNNIGLYE